MKKQFYKTYKEIRRVIDKKIKKEEELYKNLNLDLESDLKLYRLYKTPLENLDLSVRAYNMLRYGYEITDLGKLVLYTKEELSRLRNFGKKSLEEVRQKIKERGLELKTKNKINKLK